MSKILKTASLFFAISLTGLFSTASGAFAGSCLEKVPLPEYISLPHLEKSTAHKNLVGIWEGKWYGVLCHVLVVESVHLDSVQVIYSWGAWGRTIPGYKIVVGNIKNGQLTISLNNDPEIKVAYTLTSGGKLAGRWLKKTRLEDIPSTNIIGSVNDRIGSDATTSLTKLSEHATARLLSSAHSNKNLSCLGESPLPLPITVKQTKKQVSTEYRKFFGTWSGRWGGKLCSTIVITNINESGGVELIYSRGRAWSVIPGYSFERGEISKETFTINLKIGIRIEYEFKEGKLFGRMHTRRGTIQRGVMVEERTVAMPTQAESS